mgnify:CR=1 FL=1
MNALAAELLEPVRPELTAYLGRLVLRQPVAEELAQTALMRAWEHRQELPLELERARAWLFRVATNLAFDSLRLHSHKREHLMGDLRALAIVSDDFKARSRALSGTPETKAIAREHVAACFACVMTRLPERRAAALLLREVHGFALDETADMLQATPTQVKNWLQEARAEMTREFDSTCALVHKQGVCHQCRELDGYMGAHQGDPLPAGAAGEAGFDQRLALVRLDPHAAGGERGEEDDGEREALVAELPDAAVGACEQRGWQGVSAGWLYDCREVMPQAGDAVLDRKSVV